MTVPGLLARRGDVRALALSALFLTVGPPARAQLISIKTVPVAQGDQFDIFPSQHQGMGGPSIALADTLLDPFRNPAKGARLAVPRFVSSPTFYGVSNRTGGGRTLPLAAFTQRGAWYGGLSLALQEIDPSQSQPPVSQPIGIAEPLRQFGPNRRRPRRGNRTATRTPSRCSGQRSRGLGCRSRPACPGRASTRWTGSTCCTREARAWTSSGTPWTCGWAC